MTTGAADAVFMELGVQYYVAAQSAALAQLLPVWGNLYHHALEMFLKAGLSRKHSLPELKKTFGHRLIDIWKAFKAAFPSTALAQFDTTIAHIEKFEDIRYPENVLRHGAQMVVAFRGSAPVQISQPSSPPEPLYTLYVDDVDRLIGEMFRASSKNPYHFTLGLNSCAREMLGRNNPVADQILGK